jgi:Cu/Ag efflux protein CusF
MIRLIAIAVFAAFPLAALAQASVSRDANRAQPIQLADATAPLTEGEVRKVDKSAGKLTIKHGPIVNLDMPPMTMVFRVQEPALLEKVQAGEKVKFRVEKIGGQYTVTRIERAQ